MRKLFITLNNILILYRYKDKAKKGRRRIYREIRVLTGKNGVLGSLELIPVGIGMEPADDDKIKEISKNSA